MEYSVINVIEINIPEKFVAVKNTEWVVKESLIRHVFKIK